MPENPVATDLLTHAKRINAATGALQASMKAVAAELAPPRPAPAGGGGAG